MVHYVLTQTSTGKVICEKDLTDNWHSVYFERSVLSWSFIPEISNDGKTMVCKDRQRDHTVTIFILDGQRDYTMYWIRYIVYSTKGRECRIRYYFNYDRFVYSFNSLKNNVYCRIVDYSGNMDKYGIIQLKILI